MAGSSGEATVPGRRLGVVFYVTVAISAVFVVCGVVFTETFGGGARGGRRRYHDGARVDVHADLVNSQIIAATPFGLLMLAIAWSLLKAIRTDYREERRQLEDIMAYDGKVDERQMEEIRRRREVGEPIGRTSKRDD